jgi:hypothetical protein
MNQQSIRREVKQGKFTAPTDSGNHLSDNPLLELGRGGCLQAARPKQPGGEDASPHDTGPSLTQIAHDRFDFG